MRTTVDIPDDLFRRTKATAAARGMSLKQLIVEAVERTVTPDKQVPLAKRRPKLPVIHLEPGRTIDLSNFNFDDLLP